MAITPERTEQGAPYCNLKVAHQKAPQRSSAPSQEKIRTQSYPWISFKRRWRRLKLQSYCQAVLIAHLQTLHALEHSCALKLLNTCFVTTPRRGNSIPLILRRSNWDHP